MIGPVTALGFVAALDDIARFEGPHQVAAYLGLVPNERSSGEQQHRGRITERGDSRTRWLLVEAAWRIRRSKTRRWRRSTRAPSGSRPAAASAAPRCSPPPRRPPVIGCCLTFVKTEFDVPSVEMR